MDDFATFIDNLDVPAKVKQELKKFTPLSYIVWPLRLPKNKMETLSNYDLKKLLIVLAIYLTSLFAANTLGLKIMPFLFGSHLSVAFICFQ